MDPNSSNAGNNNPNGNPMNNRLHLNFGNDRFAPNDRAYPTTPSTFPNPIFPGGGQAQQPQQQQQQQQAQQGAPQSYNQGFAPPAGYFMNNQYPLPRAIRSNKLLLGISSSSSSSPTSKDLLTYKTTLRMVWLTSQASPGQRPRTAGAPGQPQGHSNYLNPMPTQASQQVRPEFQAAPERNPDRYGNLTQNNQKKCSQLAADFFKDSVKRARDRNVRQSEMEQRLADPNQSQSRREQTWSNAGKQEAKYLRFLRTRDRPDNYNTLKIIGKGAFGEVKLVQKKQDGKVYAMKSLIKSEMFKKDQLAHVRAERDILAESDSPWVVKLFTTFQDQDFLYMLMEFLPGGDLMTMLIKYEIFSEDITRFYIAEIVLAIEAVHKLGFIHRDIKPDNILLDRGGHVKLTDFGLSTGFHKLHDNSYYQQLLQGKSNKPRNNRQSVNLDEINLTVSNRSVINDWRKSRRVMAYSTVGTPDYIAPEIFSGHGYSYDCDWWSLGTIMFECQVGWPPFCAEDAHDTYRKIVAWRTNLYFPEDVQLGPEAENLIRSLVCNSENRLGRVSADEIKSHKFFRGVEFDTLRRIRAPFEPKLASNVDTTYFPTDEIDQTDNATHLKQAQAAAAHNGTSREEIPEMSLPFIGYTFKRFESNYR
ncbi:serine threonine-protein kinase cot-1 [Botrytis cinerea]